MARQRVENIFQVLHTHTMKVMIYSGYIYKYTELVLRIQNSHKKIGRAFLSVPSSFRTLKQSNYIRLPEEPHF